VAALTLAPKLKSVLIIGDPFLGLIGAAAGIDYYIFDDNCDSIVDFLKDKINRYGTIIILRRISEKCNNLREFLSQHSEVLVIMIDSPIETSKIDPKKYYEELMTKYIGLRIGLK
jgi:hypothetical protein